LYKCHLRYLLLLEEYSLLQFDFQVVLAHYHYHQYHHQYHHHHQYLKVALEMKEVEKEVLFQAVLY
jgi:hypothetical protein